MPSPRVQNEVIVRNADTMRTATVQGGTFTVSLTLSYCDTARTASFDDITESYEILFTLDVLRGWEGRQAAYDQAVELANEFAMGEVNAREIYAILRPLGKCELNPELS